MAPSKKPPSKAPHHGVNRPSGGRTKKSSTSTIQHTLSSKHHRVGMDNLSSNSSLSSIASIEDCEDFVPTPLPPGMGIVSSDVQVSFRETLDVMSRLDFRSLTHDKSIEWNVALSQTCLRISKEMTHLQNQLSSSHDANNLNAETRKRDAFAKLMYPLIKKHSHQVFTRLVFPSAVEVTTTMGNALSSYGLTSTSPIAKYIFDEVVFKQHGSSASDIICVDDQSSNRRHPYDTTQIRDELWVKYGIGSVSVKEVGRIRNTVTNICRDATRKSCTSTARAVLHYIASSQPLVILSRRYLPSCRSYLFRF